MKIEGLISIISSFIVRIDSFSNITWHVYLDDNFRLVADYPNGLVY